jgi:hypothetical protein
VPSYSVPGVQICSWFISYSSIDCQQCAEGYEAVCDECVPWTQECWTTPSYTAWSSFTLTGTCDVDTTTEYNEDITFSLTGPSSSTTTSLTIDSIKFTTSNPETTETYTIASNISCTADASGNFPSSIALSTLNYTFEDASFQWVNTLLLCPSTGSSAWLTVQSVLTIVTYYGYNYTTTLTMPITSTTQT